jgi:hypothetical protein
VGGNPVLPLRRAVLAADRVVREARVLQMERLVKEMLAVVDHQVLWGTARVLVVVVVPEAWVVPQSRERRLVRVVLERVRIRLFLRRVELDKMLVERIILRVAVVVVVRETLERTW